MVLSKLKEAQANRLVPLLALALVCLVGAAVILTYTKDGPGLTGDSIDYIWGAKSLLSGQGYSYISGGGERSPIIGFPPLTAVSLALVGLTGADLIAAGRWLNVSFFVASTFLAGYFTLRYTRSTLAALVVSGLLVTQRSLVLAHAWLMSEGLFILLTLLSCWALLRALDHGSRRALALSGLLAGLAVLTRYVGVMLVPAAILTIAISPLFLGKPISWKRRITDVFLFAVASGLPVALWFGRNLLLGGTAANRQTGFYLMSQELFAIFMDTMLAWLYLPELGLKWRMRVIVFGVLMAGIVGAFVFRELRQRMGVSGEARRCAGLPWLMTFYFPLYVLLIWVNSSFLDSTTSDGGMRRYLTPAFVLWVLLVVNTLYRATRGRWEKQTRTILAGLSLALMVGYGIPTAKLLVNVGFEFGYMDNVHAWQAETDILRGLEADRALITNNPQLLYALCERYSYALPSKAAQTSGNLTIENETTLRQRLENGALLVFFLSHGDPAQNAMADVLVDGMGLEVIAEASHMRVFGVQP